MARHGDALAVVDADGTSVAYDELAARVADRTARLGAEKRLVAVLASSDLDTLVTYLAALAGGHAVAVASTTTALHSLLATYDPDVVAAHGELVERRSGTAHVLAPELSLLLSTSGSTGSPKLVRLSARSVDANADAIVDYLGLGPDERAITTLPMGYCYGLSVLHSHLACGASVVLSDLSVVDPCFWARVDEHAVTSFAAVPFTFELLDRAGFEARDVPSLRTITQAGGRLDPDTVRRYAELGERRGWRLVVMYGQTEATARMAYLPPELAARRPDAIGVPIPGGAFELDPVPEAGDGVGELVYRGPNVMLGYAHGPADLALGRRVDELRTGDLARRADDGLYEITGRASRFVKLVGLRVDLDAAEALLADEGVHALCAGDDSGLAVVVEAPARPDDVRHRLAAALSVPAGAVAVAQVDELPRLDSGKPDRRAVTSLARRDATPTRPAPASAGALPDRIAALYGEVLGVTAVRPTDSFSGLGGDSLSYVEISHELESMLGHVPDGWHLRSIAELALHARPTDRPRRVAWSDTTVVVRALAMVTIVATHFGVVSMEGGGHLLLAVAGFNTARFVLDADVRDRWLGPNLARVGRVAVPLVAYLAAFAVVVEGIALSTVLLGSSYLAEGTWRFRYWFVEALVQILLVVVVVLAVPAVRRAERRSPFWFAAAVLGVTVLLRHVEIGPDAYSELRTHTVAWLFALGWVAHRADTPGRRALVSALAVWAVMGSFGDPSRELVILAGVLAVVWFPRLPVPTRATSLVTLVAASSLAIYLTHWQVFDALHAHVPGWAGTAVALVVGCGAAVGASAATRSLRRRRDAVAAGDSTTVVHPGRARRAEPAR